MPAATATRRRLTGPMSVRLRHAREDAGLTQRELAEITGAALKTINNYENPRYAGARKKYTVRDWADATGRDMKELWGAADQQRSLRSGWLNATADLAAVG